MDFLLCEDTLKTVHKNPTETLWGFIVSRDTQPFNEVFSTGQIDFCHILHSPDELGCKVNPKCIELCFILKLLDTTTAKRGVSV